MEIIRAILRKARDDLEWIVSCPNIPMLKEPVKRISWITRAQAETLLGCLPKHQQFMMRFALETGLRRHNVTHLEWSQVSLEKRMAWIHPDQAKAEKAIGVPLSNEAVLILREQASKHERWVFPYQGQPVTQTATQTWRLAIKAAGLPKGFRWHDLRHTWQVGMLKMERLYMCFKSLVVGLLLRWCNVMRTFRRSILRIM